MIPIFEYFHLLGRGRKPSNSCANSIFKSAISGTSWCLYILAILLIASCLSYVYFERKRRIVNQERLRGIQHIIERTPPKRRLGAAAREREVFRNVLKTAHSYIYPTDENKKCVVRQTRSGTIYGKFLEGKINKNNEN